MNKSLIFIFINVVFVCNVFSQTEVKFNLATMPLLIPNLAIEIHYNERKSLQLDVLGSFCDSFNGKPLHINQTILEHRWYSKKLKLFLGSNIGYGMFTLKKPKWPIIYDHYQASESYDTESNNYQSGRIIYYGISIGYKKKLNDNWAIEIFIGGGLTQSKYKGYTENNEGNFVQYTPQNKGFNGSGEVVFYRGGIMINYNLKK